MKILHNTILKLLSLVALIGGIALFIMPISEIYQLIIRVVPHREWLRYAVGLIVVVVALVGLLPFWWRRKPRMISFPEPGGNLNIHLDAVETALNRSLAKQPEVKRIAVRMMQESDPCKVRIIADCVAYKSPGDSARDLLGRIQADISGRAIGMLGDDVVTTVEINAHRIIPRELRPSRKVAETPEPLPEEGFHAAETARGGKPDRKEPNEGYLYVESAPDIADEEAPLSDSAEAGEGPRGEQSGTSFLDLGDKDKT